MRYGVIGYGLWGKRHADSIAKLDNAELVAISCKSEETAAKAKADHPTATVYREYRELLGRNDIEAVSIVLPNYLHAEVGVAALESGKDVLLEKPMANTAAECDRLIEASERSGRVLSIGEEFRLSSQWGFIKDAIEAGDIGMPMHMIISLFRFPFRHTSENWRYNKDMVGSWILEEPVHFFDQAAWYMEPCGKPQSVVAYGNSKGRDSGMYDNFSAVVKFPNDAYAVINQTLGGFEHHVTTEVVGTEGSIRTWWSGIMDRTTEPTFEMKMQRSGETQAKVVTLDTASGEAFELEDELRQTVIAFGERRALVSPQDGKLAVVMCELAEKSIREGREIDLDA